MRLLNLLLAFFIIVPLSATNFYFDATIGDDANDGLTPATAWQSLRRLNMVALPPLPQPGDSLLLKRGETFVETTFQIRFSGQLNMPYTFTAYGDPALPLPVVTSVAPLAGAEVASNWELAGADVWLLGPIISPGRLFIDGEEVLRAANNVNDVGTTDETGAFNKWFWVGNGLYLHSVGNPATTGILLTGSTAPFTLFMAGSGHIQLDSLDIQGGSQAAIGMFGVDSTSVSGCRLGAYSARAVYLIGATDSGGQPLACQDISISQNIVDSRFRQQHGTGVNRGVDDGIVLINAVQRVRVDSNTLRNWAGYGVQLFANTVSATGVKDNIIRGNHISAPDVSISAGFSVNGPEGLTTGNQVTGNTIDSTQAGNLANGNNNVYAHNIITATRQSVAVPVTSAFSSGTGYGFQISVLANGFVSHDNVVDHNLILDTDEAAFYITDQGADNLPTNNLIRNNICYRNGLAAYLRYPNGQDEGPNVRFTRGSVGPHTFQNNLFGSDGDNDANILYDVARQQIAVPEFNADNGEDGHVISGNIGAAAELSDVAARNYEPSATSPAIDAGLDLGYTVDFRGNDRLVGALPDIGPIENNPSLPTQLGDFTLHLAGKARVELRWQSLTEVATDRFIIERAVAATDWLLVGEVAAAGESRLALTYNFVDEDVPVGMVHYRLRQLDLDGSYTYSPVRSVLLTDDMVTLRRSGPRSFLINAADMPEDIRCVTADGRSVNVRRSGASLLARTPSRRDLLPLSWWRYPQALPPLMDVMKTSK